MKRILGGHIVCISLQWRHNQRDGVSNRQPHDCLFNRLFKCKWKKTPKLHVTGLCENSPVTDKFPTRRTSNAEKVSIWLLHHGDVTVIESQTVIGDGRENTLNKDVHVETIIAITYLCWQMWACALAKQLRGYLWLVWYRCSFSTENITGLCYDIWHGTRNYGNCIHHGTRLAFTPLNCCCLVKKFR